MDGGKLNLEFQMHGGQAVQISMPYMVEVSMDIFRNYPEQKGKEI